MLLSENSIFVISCAIIHYYLNGGFFSFAWDFANIFVSSKFICVVELWTSLAGFNVLCGGADWDALSHNFLVDGAADNELSFGFVHFSLVDVHHGFSVWVRHLKMIKLIIVLSILPIVDVPRLLRNGVHHPLVFETHVFCSLNVKWVETERI